MDTLALPDWAPAHGQVPVWATARGHRVHLSPSCRDGASLAVTPTSALAERLCRRCGTDVRRELAVIARQGSADRHVRLVEVDATPVAMPDCTTRLRSRAWAATLVALLAGGTDPAQAAATIVAALPAAACWELKRCGRAREPVRRLPDVLVPHGRAIAATASELRSATVPAGKAMALATALFTERAPA